MSTATTDRRSKVYLVPWDAADDGQVKRLYDQRVACGWREIEVPEWKELMLKGEKVFYWIVIEEGIAEKEEFHRANMQLFPAEKDALVDTCKSLFGQPREPTGESFYPVGHVAIQVVPEFDCTRLELPRSTIWVKNLYISWALHRGGFGRSAMHQLELIARQPPLSATHVLLDTMHPSVQFSEEFLKAQFDDRGYERPTVMRTNVDWYSRQGWELFGPDDEAFEPKDDDGNITARIPCVYMKKMLA